MSILYRGDCAECGQSNKLGYADVNVMDGGPAFLCGACHD
jgi:hypothetical protein